jgi:hypothetical protein
LPSSSYIIRETKPKRMRCEGMWHAYNKLDHSEDSREDNIKMDLKETEL